MLDSSEHSGRLHAVVYSSMTIRFTAGVYKYNAGYAWTWRSHTFIDECTPRLQVNTIRFGNAKRRRLTCGDKTKTFSFLEISIYWMILKSQNFSHHYFTTLLNYRCNLRGTASPTKNKHDMCCISKQPTPSWKLIYASYSRA